ncbi:MAG: hypothetical protein F4Z85_19825, partial [Gemmatimonadetes bacterium]|nr:hypothetical protein [Gemmatimonadota bacterium]
MKKRLIFLLAILIGVLTPWAATAEPDFIFMLSSPWPIKPGGATGFEVGVQENDGSPASGQTVSFSVSPADGTASLTSTSATTDSNGRASTTLITTSSASGTYTVTATLDNGLSVSGTADVETSP